MNIKRITSTKNEIIKWVTKLQSKSKYRYEEKLYIVEGYKQIDELDPKRIHTLVLSKESDLDKYSKNTDIASIVYVFEDVFKSLSTDITPQGILAVVHMKDLVFSQEVIKDKGLYLALDRIQDPGNLGTIIRVADGVGADGIIMNRETVDLYNPKVIKSTMGSLEHINIYVVEDLVKAIGMMKEKKITIYGAYLDDSQYHFERDYREGTCFVIGNEGSGISKPVIEAIDWRVKIPMPGKCESLNAAVASSVLLYEALRQRMQ